MDVDTSVATTSARDVQDVIDMTVKKLRDAVSIEKVVWFPHGITSISIKAKVATVEASLEVSGPDSDKGRDAL